MSTKAKNLAVVILAAVWIFGLSLWGILSPDPEMSESERRRLAQLPKPSVQSVLSGKFMSDFEKYSADSFPMRDGFRRIKSFAEYYAFMQLDSNGIYVKDGYISKLEYPLNESGVNNVIEKMNYILDNYLSDGRRAYLSIIPDKNYFLAKASGYPCLDYEKMVEDLREGVPGAEYIDIFPLLEISDYYRTDTHWRQEKITDVAETLAQKMGSKTGGEYYPTALEKPFYGVYYGQSALPLDGEELFYLDSDVIDKMTAYNFETGETGGVYDLEAAGSDPYDIFLSGPRSLMTIENPSGSGELVVFRDSFGSSIAPLLAEGYAKVTLADIRYIQSTRLGDFVDFGNADLLFLYSTLVVNNGGVVQ